MMSRFRISFIIWTRMAQTLACVLRFESGSKCALANMRAAYTSKNAPIKTFQPI